MPPLHIEPLQLGHLDALASVLLCPEVYAHNEDAVPAKDVFVLGLQRALAGPGAANSAEKWLNFLLRCTVGSQVTWFFITTARARRWPSVLRICGTPEEIRHPRHFDRLQGFVSA